MLGHAPKALYTQINLRGIYFVNDLKYYGKPAKNASGTICGSVILIDLAELLHSLSVNIDLVKTLTYTVSRFLHELGHLCDHTADPEGWQKPDATPPAIPDHRFPSVSNPDLDISYATRSRLPDSMLYAATSPEEFRAEALADVW